MPARRRTLLQVQGYGSEENKSPSFHEAYILGGSQTINTYKIQPVAVSAKVQRMTESRARGCYLKQDRQGGRVVNVLWA